MQTSAAGRPKGPDVERPSMNGSAPGRELTSLGKMDRLLHGPPLPFRPPKESGRYQIQEKKQPVNGS
jgi:hypothetical protein